MLILLVRVTSTTFSWTNLDSVRTGIIVFMLGAYSTIIPGHGSVTYSANPFNVNFNDPFGPEDSYSIKIMLGTNVET